MKPKDYIPICVDWIKNKYRDMTNPPYVVTPLLADFYLSVGANCGTAMQLNRSGLRICSSPLDWMTAYSIESAGQLFTNKFSTFFRNIKEHTNEGSENRVIEDCDNGMLSIHHFPKALSIEEGQKRFIEINQRRFAFVNDCLTQSEHIVFVSNRTEPVENLCLFLEGMMKLYSAKMTMINIRHADTLSKHVEIVNNGIQLIDYSFNDKSINERRGIRGGWHQGNNYEWRKILKRCKRTNKFLPPVRLEKKSYN